MTIEGFLPVIIHIAPVNVQLLLGLADQDPPFKTATHEEQEKLSCSAFPKILKPLIF
jgi:hypothetical protein